jgi:hypothetical protein
MKRKGIGSIGESIGDTITIVSPMLSPMLLIKKVG